MRRLTAPSRTLTDGVVTLRPFRAEDRDAVSALQDPQIPRWTLVPAPYGPAEYDAWLAQQEIQLAAGTGMHLLVVDAEDRVLGAAGVQWTEEEPDIGYWCAREQRRRGYSARVARLGDDAVFIRFSSPSAR